MTHNHKVPCWIPRNKCQLLGCSLAHTFGMSSVLVPRKQNGETSISCKDLFLSPCNIDIIVLMFFPGRAYGTSSSCFW